MVQNQSRGITSKLAIIWLAIILMASFWLTVRGTSDPVGMVLIPQVPREGEPIIATYRINNPSLYAMVTKYQFYTNGKLLSEGALTIVPGSGKTYKYAYRNPLQMGEQVNFLVRTQSQLGNYEKALSSPPYPPQVWSSFVSFATFSTAVMNSMSTMTYYQSTFGNLAGLNAGNIILVVLIALLMFMELTDIIPNTRVAVAVGELRIRFVTLIWILLVIFLGMIYSRVVIIIMAQ